MPAEAICDGCRRRAPMRTNPLGEWLKPDEWYTRSDQDGVQLACSRECIDKVSNDTGKTGLVRPV